MLIVIGKCSQSTVRVLVKVIWGNYCIFYVQILIIKRRELIMGRSSWDALGQQKFLTGSSLKKCSAQISASHYVIEINWTTLKKKKRTKIRSHHQSVLLYKINCRILIKRAKVMHFQPAIIKYFCLFVCDFFQLLKLQFLLCMDFSAWTHNFQVYTIIMHIMFLIQYLCSTEISHCMFQ